ncbi:MAG: hypothetical protein IJE10_11445 [Clostridia bacterium]|nr:hypothetical protein [Clostridia bacterium]
MTFKNKIKYRILVNVLWMLIGVGLIVLAAFKETFDTGYIVGIVVVVNRFAALLRNCKLLELEQDLAKRENEEKKMNKNIFVYIIRVLGIGFCVAYLVCSWFGMTDVLDTIVWLIPVFLILELLIYFIQRRK